MRKLIIIVALALAGCAGDSRAFYKDGASLADFQRDSYFCERDTRMAVPAGFTMSAYSQLVAEQFFVRCMGVAGWNYR